MTLTIEHASMSDAAAPGGRQQDARQTVAAMNRDEPEQQLMISMLGTTAMLFEAPGALDLPAQRRIWSLAREVETWPGVREAVPGVTNLMLTFARPPVDPDALADRLRDAWSKAGELIIEGKVVELPVVYGGEFGPHLQDVVDHTGLSVDEVVQLHCAPLYTVYALGSHPGYCYLGGMDPRIATPRRKVPVLGLPGGAVSIGGVQTGVSASTGPSGWNTIGHTSMVFFDPSRENPATLAPGDMIRFCVERIIR
ncbi:allophanate hydrolase [Paraburkholderia terrae]|uniref:Allophanate hydrolase n=2 Tax=Paraburkholderia terrae TaxID=311230 RepID=A0A2I8EXY7_9BURK|nr:allophanate hydrolase [Paraburkholderia terrae]